MNYRGTSLRVVESRASDGDTIEDSVLIAAVPRTPIATRAKCLRFVGCRFVRCTPTSDAVMVNCTFDQTPLPPEPESVEMIPVRRDDIEALVEAAGSGRKINTAEIMDRLGLPVSEAKRK